MEFIELYEFIKRKMIVRGGKKKIVKRTTKKGFKTVNGKEKRMSFQEIRKRSRSQKKASRKRKATKTRALRRRKLSLKKRG